MNEHNVFIKTDDSGRVVAINSDAFLPDIDGWQKIDEGQGNRYHHAQGNYLPKPLYDNRGIARYTMNDGKIVERTQAEMDADYVEPETKSTQEQRIADLEEALELLLSGVVE